MSRTGIEQGGSPKIPNLQATIVQPMSARPPGVGGSTGAAPQHSDAPVYTQTGGRPANQPEEVQAAAVLGGPSGIVGSVVTGHNAGHPDVPRVRRYRVAKEGLYKPPNDPTKHKLVEGKIVDDVSYDVRALKNQGIKLVEVDEEGEDLHPKGKDEKA